MEVLVAAIRDGLLPLEELLMISDTRLLCKAQQLGHIAGMNEGCMVLAEFWLQGFEGAVLLLARVVPAQPCTRSLCCV